MLCITCVNSETDNFTRLGEDESEPAGAESEAEGEQWSAVEKVERAARWPHVVVTRDPFPQWSLSRHEPLFVFLQIPCFFLLLCFYSLCSDQRPNKKVFAFSVLRLKRKKGFLFCICKKSTAPVRSASNSAVRVSRTLQTPQKWHWTAWLRRGYSRFACAYTLGLIYG